MSGSHLFGSEYLERQNNWEYKVYDDVEVGEIKSLLPKGKYKTIKSTRGFTLNEFWNYVDKQDDDECWEWLGNRVPAGYGYFKIHGRKQMAHRFAYILMNGEIPRDYVILHSCDNPPCCNPNHLSVGTSYENRLDMINKGRYLYGPNHPATDLKISRLL